MNAANISTAPWRRGTVRQFCWWTLTRSLLRSNSLTTRLGAVSPSSWAATLKKHGVVSTASYEARKFGVHSAMPASQACKLCPHAIWAPGRYDRYKVSNQVMAILRDETPHVQQVSIDEAFLDVTPTRVNREHPVLVALRIQQRVEALGVTCSVGVGTSKTVAKIASDMDKPRG